MGKVNKGFLVETLQKVLGEMLQKRLEEVARLYEDLGREMGKITCMKFTNLYVIVPFYLLRKFL